MADGVWPQLQRSAEAEVREIEFDFTERVRPPSTAEGALFVCARVRDQLLRHAKFSAAMREATEQMAEDHRAFWAVMPTNPR